MNTSNSHIENTEEDATSFTIELGTLTVASNCAFVAPHFSTMAPPAMPDIPR